MVLKNKTQIPKHLKNIWKKDYHSLTASERKSLRDYYIHYVHHYNPNLNTVMLDPPAFMKNEEFLKKEEDVKLDVELAKKKLEEDKEKASSEEELRMIWESKRFLKLEEIERLKLENFQLKMELVDKAIKEANIKKQDISVAQIQFAKKIEERLNIRLDDYKIDLLTGIIVRNPNIEFNLKK